MTDPFDKLVDMDPDHPDYDYDAIMEALAKAEDASPAGPAEESSDSDDLDLSDWGGPDPDEFQKERNT